MQCPDCGSTIENTDVPCESCAVEAADAAPRARRVRAGFVLALVAVAVAVFVAVLLLPAGRGPAPAPSKIATVAIEPTIPVDPERLAVEETIRGFYATVDAGESVTVSPYVYGKGRGGSEPTPAEATGTTTFAVARAVVGSSTADVYGRESRDVIAKQHGEVEFRLRRVDGRWLISSWRAAVEETVTPQSLTLSEVTASDVVGTLLQARQVGDPTTLRMLTTERFRLRHSSWFDGTDRSALMSSFSVTGAAKQGTAFAVTASEVWLPRPLTSTYTVVLVNGEILVDAWSFR